MKKYYLKQEAREKLKAAIEDFKNGDFEINHGATDYYSDGRIHYVTGKTKSGFIFTCFDCGLDFELIAKDQIKVINKTLDAEYLEKNTTSGRYPITYFSAAIGISHTMKPMDVETELGLALNDLASRLSNRGLFAS